MEFKGTIMFDVSPALLGAINRITDVFSATVVLNRPAPDFTNGGLVKGDSPVMMETADISQPEQSETAVTQAAPAVKYTKEQVKAAAAAKKEKRDEMKKILDDMGVKSIPALSEDQYEEFMQKISVL